MGADDYVLVFHFRITALDHSDNVLEVLSVT